jgi:hypothetical protein
MADDGEVAVFVGTFLTNGESVALCDEHMVYFCAETLHTMTGLDPFPFVAAISQPDDGTGPESPPDDPEGTAGMPAVVTPDPTPPTRTSGRLRAVSSEAPTAGAGEQDKTTAEAGTATSAN